MKIKKIMIAVLSVILMLSCISCAKKNNGDTKNPDGEDPVLDEIPDVLDDPTPVTEPTEGDEGKESEEPGTVLQDTRPINPLTGLHTDYDITKRPIAIMFNNIKRALPQYGISEADVIYEAISEGNITRLMGLYLDATHIEDIGSVRSTRLYFFKMALGHNALLVHAGQSAETKKYMVENDLLTLDATGYRGKFFYRNKDRIDAGIPLEHTLFLKGSSLRTMLDALDSTLIYDSAKTEHFWFSDTEVTPVGRNALAVTVAFVTSFAGSFKYDSETGLYTKYQFDAPHIDQLADRPIQVKNLIIVRSDMSLIKGDEYGRSVVDFESGGNGLYITNGKAVEISWLKENDDSPIKYFYADDMMPLYINKGKTYICLIAKNSVVSCS